MIPVLQTERLILRAPTEADFDAHAQTLASPRAIYIGGPFTRHGAWRDFSMDAGSWALCGFGYWTVEERATGRFLGSVGLGFPVWFPERELGWILHEDAEGKGFAFEAASAARAHAFGALGWPTLVSYIDTPNQRSIVLATRLGAVRDDRAAKPDGDPECLVYRHPAPEAVQ